MCFTGQVAHWAGSSVGSVGYPGKLVSCMSFSFVSLLLRQKLRKIVVPKLSGKEMMMMKTKALLRRICRYVSSFVLQFLFCWFPYISRSWS